MPKEKVEAIRLSNNNTTASRVFLDENNDSVQNSGDSDVPNPVETFAQCFSEYPDLMGKQIENSAYWQQI